MIKTLSVKGFRCLKDVRIDFAPLTVLVGPNDSGKSSILAAIEFLGLIQEYNDKRLAAKGWELNALFDLEQAGKPLCHFEIDFHARDGVPLSYSTKISLDDNGGLKIEAEDLSFNGNTLSRDTKGSVSLRRRERTEHYANSPLHSSASLAVGFRFPEELESVRTAMRLIGSCTRYQLRADAVAAACALPSGRVPEVKRDGQGLPALLDYLAGVERARLDEIEKALRRFSPHIQEVLIQNEPLAGGGAGKRIDFRLKSGGDFPGSQASDGLLLALGYLTLIHARERPLALLVEEPETGIHPANLAVLVELFRKLSEGGIAGAPVQVIMTTHSPYLLDCVRPEEVRVVTRTAEKGSRVVMLTAIKDLEGRLKDFRVGELWTNVTDDGIAQEAGS